MNKMTDLEQHEFAAMEDIAASYTVGVAQGRTVVGTGVAAAWKGHSLIITAQHVLKGITAEDLNFCPKAGGGLVRTKPGEEKKFTKVSKGKKFNIRKVHWQSEFDLAILELSEPPANAPTLQFFELTEKSGASPPVGTAVCLFGYPTDVAEHISNSVIMFSTASEWGDIEEPIHHLPNFDADLHLLLSYSLTKYNIGPHGFSGSGAWWREDCGTTLWNANLCLAGITLSYYRDREMIKVLRTQMVVKFLENLIG